MDKGLENIRPMRTGRATVQECPYCVAALGFGRRLLRRANTSRIVIKRDGGILFATSVTKGVLTAAFAPRAFLLGVMGVLLCPFEVEIVR